MDIGAILDFLNQNEGALSFAVLFVLVMHHFAIQNLRDSVKHLYKNHDDK